MSKMYFKPNLYIVFDVDYLRTKDQAVLSDLATRFSNEILLPYLKKLRKTKSSMKKFVGPNDIHYEEFVSFGSLTDMMKERK